MYPPLTDEAAQQAIRKIAEIGLSSQLDTVEDAERKIAAASDRPD